MRDYAHGLVVVGLSVVLAVASASCDKGTTVSLEDGTGPLLPDSGRTEGLTDKDTAGADSDLPGIDGGPETDALSLPPGCGGAGYECGTWVTDGGVLHCGVCPQGTFCSAGGKCGPVPDCTQDQLRVTELLVGGNTDSLEVPSVGPVQPGAPVPIIAGWSAANGNGCPGCERQLAVGVEGGSPACMGAGIPAPCPGTSPGHGVGELVAPLEPGSYALVAELAPSTGCGGEAHDFGTDFTAQTVGKLVVDEPCTPADCSSLGASCGLLDDGCSGKVCPGACGAGELCSAEGSCEPAPACALDILEVHDVFINGFSSSAQVAAGQPVLLMFSYQLGSQEALDGEPRQLVLGVGDTAVSCIEVGTPPACPATAPGLGSAKFQAPAVGGTFSVNLVVAAEDDCTLATAGYAEAKPWTVIGTLHVVGGCQPATCDVLEAQCGYLGDGCGGHLSCGICPGGQVCHQSGICGSPDCQNGLFTVLQAQIGGPGTSTGAPPGGQVPVAAVFEAGGGAGCGGGVIQLVLGFPGEAAACFDLGALPVCPQSVQGSVGAFIEAPELVGEHVLFAQTLCEGDCAGASAAFEQTGWKTVAVQVGTVTVEASCLPTGCAALGKECGDWGDGCGGILHCGLCPEGTACTGQGKCDSPCKEGVFEITAAGIAGSGEVGSAPAGKATSAWIDWELGNPDGCPTCGRQVVLGIGEEPQFCVEVGVPAACPKTTAGNKTGTVIAPEKSGVHSVYALAAAAGDCHKAKQQYAGHPDRKAVGTLYTLVGCTPKSCSEAGKSCGPKEDGCGNELDCGTCAPGLLCTAAGQCGCSGIDPYEPNDSPAQAFHVGDFTDKDVESMTHIEAAVEGEEDWYSVGASDVQWAIMEPFVQVTLGLDQPFEVIVAYVCLSGATPPDYTLVDSQGCKQEADLGVKLPGATGPASGFRCQGQDAPLFVQFGPECPGVDDSGTLYVAVKKTGQCSAYELDLHL
ncbi:MAG: hypothetical protein FJ109_01485 [Deltaproteobacteria bacterium]|nr:hypothetical protein [Deltaproteobacteria bacterium]